MSIRLKSNSGQYDLAETERMVNQLGAAHEQLSTVQCTVHFLDDSQQVFQIERNAFGQTVLDAAFDSLELLDRDYFGLQYFDSFFQENAVSCTPHANGYYAVWLDPTRPLRKQMNVAPPYVFFLRVKFYPSDPCRLQDEYTRYHFCLQLRKDLAEGRLHVPHNASAILASFFLQSEIGDYNPEEHRENYVSEFRFVPGQNDEFEAEVARLHRMHAGQSPTESEMNLLNRAKFLDYYGMRLYAASDAQNRPVQIGVSANGVALFASNSAKLDTYGWSRILKLLFKKEQFFLHLRPDTYLLSNAKTNVQVQPSSVVIFTLDSARSSKHLWKVCVEHHTFYRLHKLPVELANSIQPGGGLKKFGSFSGSSGSTAASTIFNRYSGRTEYQTLEDGRRRARVERTFQRTPSKRQSRRPGGSSIQSLAGAAGGSYAPHASASVGAPLQRAGSLQSAAPSHTSAGRHPPPPPSSNVTALTKLRAQATSPQPSYSSSARDRDSLSPFRDGSTSGMSSATSTLTNNGGKRSYETVIGDDDDRASVSTSAQQSAAQSAKLATTVSQLIGQLEAEQEQTFALIERNDTSRNKGGSVTPQNVPTSPTGRNPNEAPLRPSRQSAAVASPPSGADSIALKPLPPDPPAFRKPSMPQSRTVSSGLNAAPGPTPSATQPNLAAVSMRNAPSSTNLSTANLPNAPPSRNSSLTNATNTNGNSSETGALKRTSNADGAQPFRESFYGGIRRNYVNMNNEPSRNSVHGGPAVPPKPTTGGSQQQPAVPKALTALGSQAQSPPGIAVPTPKPAVSSPPNAVQLAASTRPTSAAPPVPANNNNNMVRVPSMKQIAPVSSVGPISPPGSLVRGGSRATVDSRIEKLRERAASPVSLNSQLSDAAFSNGMLPPVDSKQLIHVRIRPDAQGRYGLNVKGGTDQQLPIVISKIASGMPADCAVPRLNEGDQLVTICDQDATRLSHADIVALIRSRGQSGAELTLSVRPSLYYLAAPLGVQNAASGEDFADYEKWLKQQVLASAAAQQQSDFELSLDYLRNSLKSRAICEQFERVPRRKAASSTNVAISAENVAKNRYRDILPYDQTRVVLNNTGGGDYVNASHIEIEVPSTGIVTRYIAAQGPLDSTANDFWDLIWQQQCTFIVMLTQCVEKGRAKCHQYWPPLYETNQCGRYEVTCLREQMLPNGAVGAYCSREFVLIDVRTNEERRVTQLHYLRWLDHSVPDNEDHFIEFLLKLREIRVGHIAPMLVHCSAGIGRTGVLILIETLLILIENRRPLNLLYFVNLMRMQRALLIQTQEQFAFSCELVLRMFDRGLVRPLSNGAHKPANSNISSAPMSQAPPMRGQKFVV